jgi:hypothetical protein
MELLLDAEQHVFPLDRVGRHAVFTAQAVDVSQAVVVALFGDDPLSGVVVPR